MSDVPEQKLLRLVDRPRLEFRGASPRLQKFLDEQGRRFAAMTPEEVVEQEAEEDLRKAEMAQREEDQRQQALEMRLESSGILRVVSPSDERRLVTGDGIRETPALKSVRRWLELPQYDDRRTFLVLCGTPGAGKTFAAAVAMAEMRGRYIHSSDLVRMTIDNDSSLHSGFVILDQAGDARSEFAKDSLFAFVDKRQGSRMRTIIITNLSEPDFRAYMDNPAFWSRIKNRGIWINCKGEDMRARK